MADITHKIFKETISRPAQNECIKCGKIPKHPEYITVNDYTKVKPTIYPICKTCETPNIPRINH